jgi:hypothetical protein
MILDKLWRLRWKRDRYSRKMDRAIRKSKNHEERESLISEVMQEVSLYDDEVSLAETMALRRQAERIGVPVPQFSDKTSWEQGYNPAISYLAANARAALRGAIRHERRERWEFVALFVKDLTAPVVAILASIVSLILAWKVRH